MMGTAEMNKNLIYLLALIVIVLSACTRKQPAVCSNPAPGFLISNVQIIDGSGAPASAGAVRIADGLIASVGDIQPCAGEAVIDADGQTLAPGFIDTHSHADGGIFDHPDAPAAVNQGITTVVVGQDGGSPYPLGDFFARLEASPATINFAAYVGHNTLRDEVMGEDFKRIATAEEIEAMKAILATELESGAIGLASGLEYEPGIHSETNEVIELAHVAAAAGGRYISHIRSEDRWFEDAIDEIIQIGRETGMPVQISHIKLAMKRLWGSADELISKLDAARAEGIDITADIYPYEYWQSTIMVLLPDRDHTNRETIAEVLDQIAPPDGLWMTRFAPNPDYVGKTLAEIADLREIDTTTAFTQIAQEALDWKEETGERAEMIIGTSMETADIGNLMLWAETNICTDGGLQDLHPRGMGSYPRVLGRYVREQKLMPLETAIYKMTGLAAEHMGFTDRGFIREGAVADLVLFNPDTVIDHATPLAPHELSEGITSVWVSGELVFAGQTATTRRPGKVIRRALQ
jgi:N-acyl-D-amino-acid deacylase